VKSLTAVQVEKALRLAEGKGARLLSPNFVRQALRELLAMKTVPGTEPGALVNVLQGGRPCDCDGIWVPGKGYIHDGACDYDESKDASPLPAPPLPPTPGPGVQIGKKKPRHATATGGLHPKHNPKSVRDR
jgi:hypothetical protein